MMERRVIVLGLFVLMLANYGRASSIWPFVGEPLIDSIATNYGDFQKGWVSFNNGQTVYLKYLHSGLDIENPAMTNLAAADSGFLCFKDYTGLPNDTVYYSIGIGSRKRGNCGGWTYTHVDPSIVSGMSLGDTIHPQGFNFSRVWFFPSHQNNTLPHLHLAIVWGIGKGINSSGWTDTINAVAHPLDSLPAKVDGSRPAIGTNVNYPFFLKRDSSEVNLYSRYHMIYHRYKAGGDSLRDSMFVVNRKVDIVAQAYDFIRSQTWLVGIYKIFYEVHGKASQGAKGFIFSGKTMVPGYPDTAKSRVITDRVYDPDSSQATLGRFFYQMSNADSVAVDFDSIDSWGVHQVPRRLQGYWNTLQHKNRAWNQVGTTTQDSARFKDGFYWIMVRAYDQAGNEAKDSIQCIVNNFPPQISRTFPSRSWPLYPESQRCTLKVWFDQPMDTMSTLGFHLYLKNRPLELPGKKWFPNGNDTLMCFFPDSAFQNDTIYYFRQDSALTKDIADSLMTRCYVDTFWTGSKQVHTSEGFSLSGSLDSCWVEVRGSNLHSRFPRERYAVDTLRPHLDSLVFNQKITFDTSGNRYVGFGTSLGGIRRIMKFNDLGDTVVSFYRRDTSITSLTCDGNYVYAIKAISEGTWPHFYSRIFKFDLDGNEVGSWLSPDSSSFFCIGYSPETGHLYCSDIRTTPDYTYHDLRLYRMTTQGVVVAYRDLELPADSLTSVIPNLLTVGNDRVYLVRSHFPFFTGNNEDTVAMYDLKTLNELGRFRSGEGGPVGNITTAQSLTADKDELYVMNKSYLSSSQIMYWVHVFTPDGQSVRVCSLSGTWETGHPFRTVAVYPSIIGGRIRQTPPANWIAKNVPSGIQMDWPFVCRPGLVNAVAGYHVYRSLDVPEPNYQRITTDLVTDTFYVDKTVQGGTRYAYYLTATDDQGCESDSSRTVRITAFPGSATGGATAYNNAPKILRDGYGVLHAAYSDTNGCSYITSSDSGKNWSQPVQLGTGQYPGLALDENDSLYAAWIRQSNYNYDWTDTLTRLFFSYKDTSGHWVLPCTLAVDWSALSPQVWYSPPSLSVVQDTVRVVYEANRFTLGVPPGSWHLLWKLHYGKVPVHNPQAATWQVLDTLYTERVWNPYNPTSPSISVFQGLGHVVYEKQGKVYDLQQINDNTWMPPTDLSQSGDSLSFHPTSILTGNRLRVAWMLKSDTSSVSPSAICYRTRLLDGADTLWSVRETLSLGLQYTSQPELSAGPSAVFSANNGGSNEVYLTNRDNSGWKAPENISNTPSVGSNFPHLFTVQESTSRSIDILWTEGDVPPYRVVYMGLVRDSLLPGPWLEADVGKAKPSPFTVQRDGYLAYGSLPYQTIDYDHQKLVYRFTGLNTSENYRLKLIAYFQQQKAVVVATEKAKQLNDRVAASVPDRRNSVESVDGSDKPKIKQKVLLNGVEVGTMDLVSGVPDTFILTIHRQLYQGDTIRLTLDKKNGRFASLSELYLYRWKAGSKKVVQSNGGPQSGGVVSLLPRVYDLSQSYPNPAREGLRINYALPKESQVSLKIYNVMGQLVRTLREGIEKPGYYVATWDGKDQSGHHVASGVYLYRMEAGDFAKTRKLVVVR